MKTKVMVSVQTLKTFCYDKGSMAIIENKAVGWFTKSEMAF